MFASLSAMFGRLVHRRTRSAVLRFTTHLRPKSGLSLVSHSSNVGNEVEGILVAVLLALLEECKLGPTGGRISEHEAPVQVTEV